MESATSSPQVDESQHHSEPSVGTPDAPESGTPAEETGAALVATTAEVESEEPVASALPGNLLPVELDVSIPIRQFRVRNLLSLDAGTVVESEWGHGSDVPLASGNVLLAWSEFEVVDSRLAVRVTRLG
jgi:flagellar motor switch protein FliN/FliY